ncbi:hypothetical protein D3C87_665280 [compost metagenome]
MKNFSVVQEHFRKLRCAHCNEAFAPEGVKLLREEKDYWVVRVHCIACNQPAGVAIVGVEYESSDAPAEAREAATAGSTGGRVRGIFSSRREEEKFSGLPPISPDEVIDAHNFFHDLGSNWMDLIPKRAR